MAGDSTEGMVAGRGTMRVAVVQAAPVMFDARRSLQKLADLTADAARSGAGLVVFPEAFVAGYPKGHDFGVSVGMRSPEGRDEFRRLFESAVEVPGKATEAIGKVARDQRRPPRRRRGRAGRRDSLLHGAHLRPRRHPPGQAPQADADGDGAGHLGQRRRVHPPGRGLGPRQGRRGHLLGELHAPAADGDVRQGGRALLCDHRGRPGHLAAHGHAHRPRRPLLRLVGLPVPPAWRPAARLPHGTAPGSARTS